MSSTDIFSDKSMSYMTQYQVAQEIRRYLIDTHKLDAHEAAFVVVWDAQKCLEWGMANTAAAVVWETGESCEWAYEYTGQFGQMYDGTFCEPYNGFILALYRDQ